MSEDDAHHGADGSESERAQQGMAALYGDAVDPAGMIATKSIGRHSRCQATRQGADQPKTQDHPSKQSHGCADDATGTTGPVFHAEKEPGADTGHGTHDAAGKRAEKMHVQRSTD